MKEKYDTQKGKEKCTKENIDLRKEIRFVSDRFKIYLKKIKKNIMKKREPLMFFIKNICRVYLKK